MLPTILLCCYCIMHIILLAIARTSVPFSTLFVTVHCVQYTARQETKLLHFKNHIISYRPAYIVYI